MNRIQRRPCLLALVLLASTILAGCNTVEGMGEDINATGRAISNWADHAGGEPTTPPESRGRG